MSQDQSPSAPALSAAAKHVVAEAKKKFVTALDDELLDYKHNHPQHIENCANMLIKIFGNILEHPQEEKYRQIKATSNAFKSNVAGPAKGGEQLMTLAGFKTQVVDLQKYWVFESDSHGIKDSILHECLAVLHRALHTISEKAERKRKEQEEKVLLEKQRREQILNALEDDKADRRLRSEIFTPAGTASASGSPAQGIASHGHAAAEGAAGSEHPAKTATGGHKGAATAPRADSSH